MLRSALFFLVWANRCVASFSPDNPQKIATATLEGEPTALVAGCVYALSGDYCETAVDLCVPGVEPLPFQRTFTSFWDEGTFLGGWSANTQCFLEKEGEYYAFTQEHGGKVYFSPENFSIIPECFSAGLTNCSGGLIGAQNDWKTARLNPLKEGGEIVLGDNTRYLFDKRKLKIFKPNGTVIISNDPLCKKREIAAKGIDGKKWGFIRWNEETPSSIVLEGSNGQKVTYKNKLGKTASRFQVEAEHLPLICYNRSEIKQENAFGRIEKVLPEGRFLQVDHYRKGTYWIDPKVKIDGTEDPAFGKVASLKEPAGADANPVETYRFIYHSEKNQTDVYDAYGHLTRYQGDENKRLIAIEHYKGTDHPRLYCQERLFWGKQGRLRCRALLDEKHQPKLCIHFKYDKAGNVITETLWGNLTGNANKVLQLSGQGVPSGGENNQRHFTYSTDGFNLKLSEKNRKNHTFYQYELGSDRIAAKLVSDKKKIRLRFFYKYDLRGFLSEEIKDNGSGEKPGDLQDVTERHVSRYFNAPEGWTLQKEESYLDMPSQQEVRLGVYEYAYDGQGRKKSEARKDGKGILLYKQEWDYDHRGRLIRHVTPLGHVIESRYDENGNKVAEIGPDPELRTHYSYDYSNRLTRTEKVDRNGAAFSASNSYYYTHQKYTSTDFNGETHRFLYDALGRLELVQYPPLMDGEGSPTHPREHFKYDLQGFVTHQEACDGGVTRKEYNIFGKPTLIETPDGAVEHFIYNLAGELIQAKSKEGALTTIQRDFLGRPLIEEVHDAEGRLISKLEKTYDAFHLLSEKGFDGIETYYCYDGAGRLKIRRVGERTTLYFYNSLGQVVQERDFFGPGEQDYIETIRRYTVLGALLEERSPFCWKTYTYDPSGNRASTTTHLGQKSSTLFVLYDALGRKVEERTDQGLKTVYLYDGHQKTTIDPSGNQRVELFSPQGFLLQAEQYDPFHQLLLKQTWTYDKAGRKLSQRDEGKGVQTWAWEYDLMGNLTGKTEAVGTPLQKKHVYQYDFSGRKIKWIKPDGVTIAYRYDLLGRLLELTSSDRTLHYLYSYDRFHRLVRVDDCIWGTHSLSAWDRQGCLSHEKLANGLGMSYRSDRHGRILGVVFPDKSGIEYVYEKGLLKTVSRKSPQGETAYQHTYVQWNKSGFPLKMELPGKGGEIIYEYNTAGQVTKLLSQEYQEGHLNYDSKGNLTSREINGVREDYRYDSLSHLTVEKGVAGGQYAYDPSGNRIKKDGEKAKVNILDQVVKQGSVEYVYDACGRLVCQKEGGLETLFLYDCLDRLVEVIRDGKKIIYTYDYAHRRLSKEVDGVKTLFLYQGHNEIGEQDEKGNWINLRILGAGKGAEVGAAIGIELDGIPHIPIHSSTGNVALLLDFDGQIKELYRPTAFGEEGWHGFQNPWRFKSKRFDPETLFIFFGRRYYIPHLGRWLTQDPLEELGSANLYAFVSANPLNHMDLYGLTQERPSLLQKVGRVIGSFIKGIGDHLVPIPHVRDAISALGHRLKGGTRLNFRELCRNPHSAVGYVSAPRPENGVSISYICGVLNRPQDCAETADLLSKRYGDYPVHFCYNSSEGLALDLIESVAQILGIKTSSVETAAQLLRERIQAVGDQGKVFLHLHSQGGIIGYRAIQRLTPAEKKLLHVTTYGSAKQIHIPELGSAINIVAKNDPIPWIADPLGSLRSYWGHSDSMCVIPSPQSPVASHSMQTYLSTLRRYP